MKILREEVKVRRFFDLLGKPHCSRLILLDYDGTLSPFVPDPKKALPYPGIPQLLEELVKKEENKVVIISGRAAKEVQRLLGVNAPLEIWGSHGGEKILLDGQYQTVPLNREITDYFSKVEDWAKENGLIDRMEKKHGSLAFHVRGLPKEMAQEILKKVTQFFSENPPGPRVSLKEFDGGVELRGGEIHKGEVVSNLIAQHNEVIKKGVCAYFGDDLTDEDAFNALRDQGVSFLVRSQFRPTAADVWLKPPEELMEVLGSMC